ncbi:YerC/YecD family TrpR-related protein [Lentisalinibacter salinarum]|uniref:YerC/YecD family TrpR-related protein n=1 Tax=Lentisalinibacter salinarum TaxID=2992239 RepID=UPI0038690C34
MKPNRETSARQAAREQTALCEALVAMRGADEMRALLADLCTPAELQALVDRWRVVQLLDEGLPYRRINEMTGVSVTTIGRVARFLADGFGGYRTALERTRKD